MKERGSEIQERKPHQYSFKSEKCDDTFNSIKLMWFDNIYLILKYTFSSVTKKEKHREKLWGGFSFSHILVQVNRVIIIMGGSKTITLLLYSSNLSILIIVPFHYTLLFIVIILSCVSVYMWKFLVVFRIHKVLVNNTSILLLCSCDFHEKSDYFDDFCGFIVWFVKVFLSNVL